ncbi:rabphilin-3A isoform X1 [Venturia canescens]|uniref:rabphilin-3A isoform X1 n=1 Tax=Venturia canescens TaxID=32260 RepID=UPI001C9CCADD|nr:rabphilin-3A isoform X1 [Venturia canescens]
MDTTHGTSGSKGARWVCPNDRQLALRAKLRTGWSVKSGSFDSRFTDYTYSASCPGNLNSTSSSSTSFALTDAERASIIQVIQRAEALDVSEQERVGKLVERLENMKRNVSTVTTTRSSGRSCGSRCSGSNGCVCSCALCGEKFAVLGAGPSLCRDCRKYICQKCGIETTPSYLLTPGSSATSTSTGATTPQHQHNVSQHLRIKSPSSNNKWFLCRICAETREMWKKSGAWFFKGLPKYVLPEKKERGRSRAGSRASGWTLTGGTKSLEPPEQDSSSDDEATRRMTRTRSLLSANCEVEVFPSEGATTPVGQSTEMRPPQLGVRSNSSTSEHERRPSSENPPEAADNAVSQTANRRVSSSTSTSTIRSKSGSSANNGQRNNSRRPNADEQRDSNERTSEFSTSVTQVHLASGNNASTNNSSATSSTRIRDSPNALLSPAGSPNTSSESSFALANQHPHHDKNRHSHRDTKIANLNHLEQLPRIDQMAMAETAGYGTLEISLRYEPVAQCLQCKILRARGLRAMDIHGLADPFCKLNILPRTLSTTTKLLRTKTVHKTRDPEFNEQLNFYGITESDMKSGRALHVLIQQDDRVARDFLGEAKFPLYEVPPYQTRYYNVFLEDHYPVSQEEKIWGEDSTNGRGQIQLTLSYSTRRRVLLVTVERAINLLSMDSNGFSDPFVKLCLTKEQQKEDASSGVVLHHPHHHRHSSFGQSTIVNTVAKKASKKLAMSPRNSHSNVHSTSVKWKTLNPEWNEEFAFEIRLTDLTGLALVMSVWDKDFGKSNDYLGGLTLSCSSKGARLRHWIDTIKFPDHNHQAVHNLIEEQIPID